jgi:hypothetical protein
MERLLIRDLRASKADYEAGRYLGPFDDAADLIKALRGATIPKPKASAKRSTSGFAKSTNASTNR